MHGTSQCSELRSTLSAPGADCGRRRYDSAALAFAVTNPRYVVHDYPEHLVWAIFVLLVLSLLLRNIFGQALLMAVVLFLVSSRLRIRRSIPPAIRRARHHRDGGCRFPGCGVPFGQGHHIRHWAHGGPTTLSNLAMLCRRHHRAVHEEGYHVERHPDGALSFRRPDGRLLPDVPPPPAVAHDPSRALRARNEALGLRLNARTACPGWQGERLDVGWAIDVLHPRAVRPRAIGE